MGEKTAAAEGPTGTASEDEVARFTAMAEEWWDPHGKFRPLHQLNPPRIDFVRAHVVRRFARDLAGNRPFEGLTLLDVGCGGGLLSEPMHRLGATVTGIDAGEKNIGIARTHAEQEGLDIDYRHMLPEDLASEGRQFDIVTVMEVVEHVPDLNAFLEAACALVKPGGVLLASTVNRTVKAFALAKIGAEYILRWLPRGTHDFSKFVKPSELARGLAAHGLEMEDLKGLGYTPLVDEWFLTANLDVNYLAYAVKD